MMNRLSQYMKYEYDKAYTEEYSSRFNFKHINYTTSYKNILHDTATKVYLVEESSEQNRLYLPLQLDQKHHMVKIYCWNGMLLQYRGKNEQV